MQVVEQDKRSTEAQRFMQAIDSAGAVPATRESRACRYVVLQIIRRDDRCPPNVAGHPILRYLSEAGEARA